MPANVKSLSGRFELPKIIPINYSLTDGTGIPPPPDSPIEERPQVPAVPPASASGNISSAARHDQSATTTNGYESRRRTSFVDTPPMSPSSTRQGSIRRFLSRKSLNANYTDGTTNMNGSHEDLTRLDRPESAMSQRSNVVKKHSGNWFKRLGSSNSSKRASVIYEDKKQQQPPQPPPLKVAPVPVKKGPPPPKLPELKQLVKGDGGSLGAEDMFKNIK
ncbi:hypothetical protein PZA11_007423 [Diplocarpon coronariae]|uniref:Uncharacterized protein n=1 Tax=Diplocarpon coronariae TaxID=2795749 RepID=A0A218Z4X9_9HELO|nr:hypothetical protein JHW43_004467 [Diplocarpon mali]OWP03097.1 hypothetical protein B2J93_6414 [Marssonina coronariae]